MRIGVALCTYNGEKYLAEQLDSIFTQTRLPDEMLVQDDGSSDRTIAILDSYAAKAPFTFRVVRNPKNLGFVRNFETAIERCGADLIVTSDQDDSWRRDKLEVVANVFRSQPRIGVAWRPVPGSSLVIRAGYGVYRNTSVYQPITSLLAQQPPLSTAFTISNSLEHPLTLANGFTPPTSTTSNTFAVDPNLRVGASQNWQALVQRDLPGSLTMTATYLGTKGSHLFQEFLPNTYAPGSAIPCPSCPAGFIYLTSNGSSSRHAGQFQLRRRLRNGLAASVQYTLAKATDNAAAFAGVSLNGGVVAQDWRDLEGELAPSNFDQRHQVTAQFQYTSGVGVAGGALIDGVKGQLLKGWTVTSQLTTGSGLPFTPIYLAPTPGTGVTGSLRPSLTGATLTAPDGYYLNPEAYTPPAPGQWGSAGRNSVVGPAAFTLNAAVARTFQWTERLSFDWRLDFTNVLNLETYTGVNNIIGGKQFGLPSLANTPRKVLSTMRLRF